MKAGKREDYNTCRRHMTEKASSWTLAVQ